MERPQEKSQGKRPDDAELKRRLLRKAVSLENGCWVWTGSKNKDGYGKLDIWENHSITTHRLSWELANGPIPNGLCVLHNCPGGDNPACCNPSHLFLGTHADNIADKVKKKRHARGESIAWAKLTWPEVAEIRRLRLSTGLSLNALAKLFGVSKRCILFIVQGKTWIQNQS